MDESGDGWDDLISDRGDLQDHVLMVVVGDDDEGGFLRGSLSERRLSVSMITEAVREVAFADDKEHGGVVPLSKVGQGGGILLAIR